MIVKKSSIFRMTNFLCMRLSIEKCDLESSELYIRNNHKKRGPYDPLSCIIPLSQILQNHHVAVVDDSNDLGHRTCILHHFPYILLLSLLEMSFQIDLLGIHNLQIEMTLGIPPPKSCHRDTRLHLIQMKTSLHGSCHQNPHLMIHDIQKNFPNHPSDQIPDIRLHFHQTKIRDIRLHSRFIQKNLNGIRHFHLKTKIRHGIRLHYLHSIVLGIRLHHYPR